MIQAKDSGRVGIKIKFCLFGERTGIGQLSWMVLKIDI